MKRALKKFFIPHEENNYHPHILHTKRAFFYGAVFLTTKVLLFGLAIALPMEVFGLPDVLAEEQKQIVALTNEVRQHVGRPALADSRKLDISAQDKANDMSKYSYFAHDYNHRDVADWLKLAGYDYEVAGENLAVGFATADEVVAAWVNSPAHYSNLVDRDFKDLGVGLSSGVYEGQPTVFIAQHFASPALAYEQTAPAPKILAVAKSVPKVSASTTIATSTAVAMVATSSVLSARIENNVTSTPPLISNHVGSTIDKYVQAKAVLSPVTNIFNIARDMYLLVMVFFIIALALKIIIEIRKQHPHVILQTSGLIALLFILWKF